MVLIEPTAICGAAYRDGESRSGPLEGGLVVGGLLWPLAFDELSTYAACVKVAPWFEDVAIRIASGLNPGIPPNVFESISAQAT